MAVVGEGNGALEHHVADLGQGLALLVLGQRADRADVHEAGGLAAVDLVADLGARVGDGGRVGHRGDVREAAVGRGARARLDGLLVLEARIAEVDVHVEQAGHEVLARAVDDLGLGREVLAHLRDLVTVDEDVEDLVQAQLRVHDVGALDQICH